MEKKKKEDTLILADHSHISKKKNSQNQKLEREKRGGDRSTKSERRLIGRVLSTRNWGKKRETAQNVGGVKKKKPPRKLLRETGEQ